MGRALSFIGHKAVLMTPTASISDWEAKRRTTGACGGAGACELDVHWKEAGLGDQITHGLRIFTETWMDTLNCFLFDSQVSPSLSKHDLLALFEAGWDALGTHAPVLLSGSRMTQLRVVVR